MESITDRTSGESMTCRAERGGKQAYRCSKLTGGQEKPVCEEGLKAVGGSRGRGGKLKAGQEDAKRCSAADASQDHSSLSTPAYPAL